MGGVMNNLRLLAFLTIVLASMQLVGAGKTKPDTTKKETLDLHTVSHPSPTISLRPAQHISELLSLFTYPGSIVIRMSNNQRTLQSAESVTTITSWYVSIIQKQHMNINTFVRMNENGDVINKLNGTSQEKEISVVIEKKQNMQETTMTVHVQ